MSNILTDVAPKLLAQGLVALRNTNVLPALVNNSYSDEFAAKGLTVDVPIPSAIAATDVTPANTPPSTADVHPTTAQVTLNQWKEAAFYLTDKDLQQAMDGVIPMQASEAIGSIADVVNAYLFSLYPGVYGYTGTAGTTPFTPDAVTGLGSTADATNARKILNKQKAYMNNRRFVLDPDAEANALNLRAFQDSSWSASPAAIKEGDLTRKLGFDWFMDQQVPTHVTGTLSNGSTHSALVNGVQTVGANTVNIDSTTLTGTVVVGDIFTVAGDTQTYVVTTAATAASNAITGLAFQPAAKVAWADNAAITVKASHVVNLAFHRDAFAFASRPLLDSTDGLGNILKSASDPISGISLRLEISREHKRTRFSYDILYGATLVRAALATRLAG